jgi:ADP-heptose:LPS heptosyltransferase
MSFVSHHFPRMERNMPALERWLQTDIKHIAVFRALQLGDMLNAVPAFRALRAAFPEARIALVGLPWAQGFVKRFHAYLDEFIRFPGIPGFPEQPADIGQFPYFLKEMQAGQFDLAIQMQGSGEIANTIVSLWGAKQLAGFYKPGQYCPDKDTFLEYPEQDTEVWRHLRLMKFLGLPLQEDELEFPLFEEDWKEFQQLQEKFVLGEEYVCIHPGARKPERRWPVENFAGVADGLAARNMQIVLTGTGEESDLTAAVAGRMKTPAIDLAGRTSLGTLAALLSQARLVISNDTGISHVAAAVKAPSVILFSVPDMERWAPKNRQLHRVLWPAQKATVAEVLAQAESHLQKARAGDPLDRTDMPRGRVGVKS